MKKTEAKSVGQIIDELIDQSGSRESYDRQQVCYLWSEVVGPIINRCTMRRYIDGRTLHVHLSSAPLRSELMPLRDQLIERLNRAVGADVISEIIFH